jgi:membrane protein DedA with SNARE-associated domain
VRSSVLDSILDWLRHHEGPLSYLVVGLAALIEYVFPPFPGDAIAIFAIYLVFAADFSGPATYGALVLGAVIGGQAMWALGRSIGKGRARPKFLQGPRASKALDRVEEHFEKHGNLFLVVHRFIPALRAFVYVGAGMAGLSWWRVLLLGGLSAVLWNGVLMGGGWLVASNWHALARYVSIYSAVAITVVAVVAVVWFVRSRKKNEA